MRRVKKFKLNAKNEIVLGDGTIIQTKGDKGTPGDSGEGVDEGYGIGSQIPGPKGTTGLTGSSGRPGLDGVDGEDAWPAPNVTGLPGPQGLQGVGIPGRDGEDREDELWPLGSYDPAGTGNSEATAHVGVHESTYNHANYNTAYGWGNHAGLYSLFGHDHAGIYDPAGTGHAEAAAHVADHAALITGVHGLIFTAGKTFTLTESLTLNALPIGGLAVATGANTLGSLAVGLTTQILVGGGAGTVPAFGTDIPTAVTIGGKYVYRADGTAVPVIDGGTGKSVFVVGDIIHATGTTTLAGLADVAIGSYLASGGVGVVPAFATLNQAAVAGLTTADGPSFAHIHLTDVPATGGALITAAESWIGPSSMTGVYFKGGFYGFGITNPDRFLTLAQSYYSLYQGIQVFSTIPGNTPGIVFRKSHHNTIGTNNTTIDTDYLSDLEFFGVNAAGNQSPGGDIQAIQDGAAGTYVPTNYILKTYGAESVNANQLVLHNDGNVGISTNLTGAGVTYQKFNVAGSQLFVGADSSQESPMFQVVPSYVVNTHASYTSRTILSQWAIGGAQECMRMESGVTAMLSFFGVGAVVRPTALTAALTSITHTALGTPDYALQDLVQNTGFGFVTKDEGNTLLSVVLRNQVRIGEIETKLQSLGLLN